MGEPLVPKLQRGNVNYLAKLQLRMLPEGTKLEMLSGGNVSLGN